jgi:hypothetical protein
MPAAYALGVAAISFAALGWVFVAAGVFSGRRDALAVFVLAFGLSGLRTLARRRTISVLWGETGLAENRRFMRTDWALAPLALIMSALCGWSALLMRRTTWAGITYRVRGPQSVEILARAANG